MGNNNSGFMAIIALLGLAYLVSKPSEEKQTTINGSQFPWLSLPPALPETVFVDRPIVIERYFTERSREFHTIAEEAEESLEEMNLGYLDALKGLAKAKAVQKEVAKLKEMVQPTTTFDPTKLTQADLDKAQALAEVSRPASGHWHPPSVPNK